MNPNEYLSSASGKQPQDTKKIQPYAHFQRIKDIFLQGHERAPTNALIRQRSHSKSNPIFKMKAQLSLEFLLNFTILLFIISILLTSFTLLLNTSDSFSSKVLEKAKAEQFARTLDAFESSSLVRIGYASNYSTDSSSGELRITSAGESVAYTIYGIKGDDSEPI